MEHQLLSHPTIDEANAHSTAFVGQFQIESSEATHLPLEPLRLLWHNSHRLSHGTFAR